MEFGFAAEMIR